MTDVPEPRRGDAPWRRALLVVAGYALAVGAGLLAVWVRSWFVDPHDALASSGMHAFADMTLFLGVAGVVSMAPSYLLFRSLPRGEAPWRIASGVMLAIAFTALLAAALRIAALGNESLVRFGGAALLRAFLSPAFVLVDGVAALAAPSWNARGRFVAAAVLEMFAAASIFAPLLFMR